MSEWTQFGDTSEKPLYIRWFISEWCNYTCDYCFWTTHPRKGKHLKARDVLKSPGLLPTYLDKKHNNPHSFDNYPVEEWVAAFERLSPRLVAINITGGEPFLDFRNFSALLHAYNAMDHVRVIRVDSNISWKAKRYESIDWSRISLNASYHPTQTTLDKFVDAVKDKLDEGISIGMVNFVLDPRQLDEFEVVRTAMERFGVFVNANVFIEVRDLKQIPEAREIYERYVPPIDVRMKTNELVPKGKLCRYPVHAYELRPTGLVNVGCFPNRRGHFIKGRLPEQFTHSTPCPYNSCGCLDMYGFLDEITERGNQLDLLDEYVSQVKAHREQAGIGRMETLSV